jgi:RecJ-like exonuclease
MKVPALFCAAALFAALPVSTVFSAEPPPAAAPAAPADGTKVYSPIDLEALKTVINETVTIEGTIVAAAENKSGTVRYLNFTKNFKESIGLVLFVKKGGDDFAMDKLKAFEGKKVRVTGKVLEHTGNLQIEIDRLDQLQEIQ